MRERLTATVLAQFDPAAITAGMAQDWAKRRVIRAADNLADRRHDFSPQIDGTHMYHRDFTTVPEVPAE